MCVSRQHPVQLPAPKLQKKESAVQAADSFIFVSPSHHVESVDNTL